MFSLMIEKALRIAAVAHAGQMRKGSAIPYLTHPVQVAIILERNGFDDDRIIAAAILHDVVEDTSVPLKELQDQFPPEVGEWVAALSERKIDVCGASRSWEDRKREHLDEIGHAPLEARAIALADKLHNIESIVIDLDLGEDVWSRFNAPRERLHWYYSEMIAATSADAASRTAGNRVERQLETALPGIPHRRRGCVAPHAQSVELNGDVLDERSDIGD
ncbi:MAG: HD domain-containing protein [Planctomycetaceae bacterium]